MDSTHVVGGPSGRVLLATLKGQGPATPGLLRLEGPVLGRLEWIDRRGDRELKRAVNNPWGLGTKHGILAEWR